MKPKKFTSLRVPLSTHNKIKTLASIKGMNINEYIDSLSDEELSKTGLNKLKQERKKYVFKI